MWRRKRFSNDVPYIPPEPYTEAPLFPEPWRKHTNATKFVALPAQVLLEIADPKALERLSKLESTYLDQLEHDIITSGIREPLQLVVDKLGRICLRDGHHRMAIYQRTGKPETFPVVIKQSDRTHKYGRTVHDVLGLLLLGVPTKEERIHRAIRFALEAIEDAGQTGWALGDAVTALRLSIDLPVGDMELTRLRSIDPSLTI